MQAHGYTMMELLVTMAIVAIVTAIGVPSFNYIITGTRMGNEIDRMVYDVNFARSEAVKRGTPVMLCPSSNGSICAGGTDWSNGWIALTGSTAIRISPALSSGDTLTGIQGGNLTSNGYSFLSGTLSLHEASNDPNRRRCIVFSTGSWLITKGSACP